MRPVRQLAAIGLLVVSIVATSRASADEMTKEQCVAASENAQTLRQRGKLRAARADFAACTSKGCPGPVRDDCVEQLRETDRMMPSIVLVVRDEAGRELRPVAVTMDGARFADPLGSAPMAVDPGEHTFRITVPGYTPLEKRLTLRERVQRRTEIVTLSPTKDDPATATPASVDTVYPDGGSLTPGPGPGPRAVDQLTIGYITGGAGLATLVFGTYFGLRAKGTYDDATAPANCPGGISRCNPAGVDGVETAQSEATIATIAFVAGLAIVGAAVALVVTAPRAPVVTARTRPPTSARWAGGRLVW